MSHHEVLDALGDGTRRTILGMIRERARSVGEIAEALPVSQPAVSQHLRVLREAGLVEVEALGRRRIYRVSAGGFEPLRAYVSSMWDETLDAFRTSLEPEAQERGR